MICMSLYGQLYKRPGLLRQIKSTCLRRPGLFCTCTVSEPRYLNLVTVPERRLVRADPHHGPVDRGLCVGHCWPLAEAGHQEVVDQVRVRPAVPAALQK